MIGVSLPPSMLCDYAFSKEQDAILSYFGSTKNLLSGLKDLGVSSVEIRNLAVNDTFTLVPQAIRALKDAGLDINIHTVADDRIYPDVLCDYYEMFVNKTNINLHSVSKFATMEINRSTTARMLRYYSDEAVHRNLDYTFSLENCRIKEKRDFVGDCKEVEKTVLLASRKPVGICFDMGHRISDVRRFLTKQTVVPNERFLRLVSHTHIHYITLDGRTHGPISVDCPEIEECIAALKGVGYKGVYNLELEAERYGFYLDPTKGFIESIEKLHKLTD